MRTHVTSCRPKHDIGFGICVNDGAQITSAVTDLGSNWVRCGLRWIWAEGTQGVYNWTANDRTVLNAEQLGVSLLGILSNSPVWARQIADRPNGPILSEALDSFHDYCMAVVERYRGRVRAYEIWNEPQGYNSWDVVQYANLVIDISGIIREADPDATVVGMTVGGTFVDANWSAHNAWYVSLLNTPGVLDACDDLSVHLYCRPYAPDVGDFRGPIPTRLDNSRDLLASLGWTRPLWATEGNWPTLGTTPGVVTEELQAEYLVRLAQICRDRGILFFPFMLYGAVTSDEAGGMGLIRPDGTRKPSFYAYRDWIAAQ